MKAAADPASPAEVGRSQATVFTNPLDWLQAAGRVLLSLLFIWDGIVQLLHPDVTAHYFGSAHVPFPEVAVWMSIPLHLLGGLALLVGVGTRIVAALLALLALGTAFGVHLAAGEPTNLLHFYKNLAIAGGLLYVVACGAGRVSIDHDGRW
jgi:putative oxidoreductase